MKIIRLLILTMIIPHLAVADVVVRRDGTRIEGTVANQGQLIENWRVFDHVAILRIDDDRLVRIPINEIDYMVLDQDGKPIVIEIKSASVWVSGQEVEKKSRISLKNNGIGLTIFGIGFLAYGAFVKMGEPELVFRGGEIVEQDTYNDTNYALMIGGVVLIIVGLSMVGADRSGEEARFQVSPMCAPQGVGVSMRF